MRDDKEFNVFLCKLVKKYPALYDYTRSFYQNKKVKDRIWGTIAKRLDVTVADCKQRWKEIRKRHTNYHKMKGLKLRKRKSKRYKLSFYLATELQFLENFMSPPRKAQQTKPQEVPNTLAIQDSPQASHSGVIEGPKVQNPPKMELKGVELNKDFLERIPDMKGMTPAQNRKFKVGIFNLVRRIVDERSAKTSN